MWSSLISTIVVTGILSSLISILVPESNIKNSVISTTNIIFVSLIFFEIVSLINSLMT